MEPPAAAWEKQVTVGGIPFSLIAIPGFKVGESQWLYICFTAASPWHQGELRLQDFFAIAAGEGLVSWDDHLASIEFGNEIVHGFGSTTVERYVIR